jgi:FkbM family methyltransferase
MLHMDAGSKTIMNWITSVSPDEKKVHELFRYLFKSGCQQRNKLFVDVGANAGFYSLVAGVYGCQVLMFDPQPLCVDLIQQNLCLNEKSYLVFAEGMVAIVGRPVADLRRNISMSALPACEGTFSVDTQAKTAKTYSSSDTSATGGDSDPSLVPGFGSSTRNTVFFRETVSLDDLLLTRGGPGIGAADSSSADGVSDELPVELHVVKIDTEGYEVPVLRSMKKLLAAKKLHHIVVEVTPLFWARDGVERETVYIEFLPFLAAGCSIQRVLDVRLEAETGDGSGVTGVTSSHQLDTPAKLHEYLVKRQFVQEDLYINCSGE